MTADENTAFEPDFAQDSGHSPSQESVESTQMIVSVMNAATQKDVTATGMRRAIK
jgi:hypothetical protein